MSCLVILRRIIHFRLSSDKINLTKCFYHYFYFLPRLSVNCNLASGLHSSSFSVMGDIN